MNKDNEKMKDNSKEYDIAMVGCGSVGVSFLCHLQDLLGNNQSLEVLIIDRPDFLAAGYAYSTASDSLLLNTKIEEMSIGSTSLPDFNEWLMDNNLFHYNNEEYVPRKLFGKYLIEILSILMESKKLRISILSSQVSSVNQVNEKWEVYNDRDCYIAKSLVMSHGGAKKRLGIIADDKYIHNPCDIYKLKEISSESRVLLVGSNLTMIDTYIMIKENNQNQEIDICSKSGWFPSVKTKSTSKINGERIYNKIVGEFKFKKIVDASVFCEIYNSVFTEEIGVKVCIESEANKYDKSLPGKFPEDEKGKLGKFIADNSVYIDRSINYVWSSMSEDSKKRLARVLKYILRYICSMPEVNSEKFYKYGGKTEIKKLKKIYFRDGYYIADFEEGKNNKYNYIVNCTGVGGYYLTANCRLAKSIINSNKFKVTIDGGIDTNSEMMAISASGGVYTNAIALGVAALGNDFIRSSFAFYNKQCKVAAQALLYEIRGVSEAKLY